MSKDAYYFSHDSNAKDDPKCVLLIEQLGLEGYGIFWVLVETLREQPSYRYPVRLIPALARRFNTTHEKMKAVVMGYELFEFDEDEFFSLSLIERMQKLQIRREQQRMAGKKSAEKRLLLQDSHNDDFNGCSTDVQRTFNACSTSKVKERKVNERKVNEIKKDKYGEFSRVLLTPLELSKLNIEFSNTDELIKFLDEYIEMKGYKAKSHYLCIKKWVADAVKEKQKKDNGTKSSNIFYEIGKEEGLWK